MLPRQPVFLMSKLSGGGKLDLPPLDLPPLPDVRQFTVRTASKRAAAGDSSHSPSSLLSHFPFNLYFHPIALIPCQCALVLSVTPSAASSSFIHPSRVETAQFLIHQSRGAPNLAPGSDVCLTLLHHPSYSPCVLLSPALFV